ncbi:hypothetical protein [Mycobacteroides abscessus]|uniref:hypothetical protein n=1 Tax=Mycobacteroides abscessus TaxID=36809 RepID=UPI0016007C57|nr:hypothetical protein [Mycobacteroides abscessus]
MMDETYEVRRMRLSESDDRLGKWSSLWADLIHVNMVLAVRTQFADVGPNVFHRRALWESAVVSYGRMVVSEKRRNVDYEELLRAARGDRGVDFHETLMEWRHDHVAHRRSRALETVAVYADYILTSSTRSGPLCRLRAAQLTPRRLRSSSESTSGLFATRCGRSTWPRSES